MDLVIVLTLTPLLALQLNSSLTWPFTDISFAILGSWMNEAPFPLPGGTSPVVTYFRHSESCEVGRLLHFNRIQMCLPMIVVFPQPFWPRMSVRGVENSMFCLSS